MLKKITIAFFLLSYMVTFSARKLHAQGSVADSPEVSTSSASANTATAPTAKPFLKRFFAAYREDWHPTLPAGPDPKRRGYAAPLDSEPFPAADWNYGGSPDIGAPDTQTYPLMQAINGASSRIKVYGWLNGGFDVSTSNRGKFANAPAAYYVSPNTLIPDQQVLYIERLPNTVQTDHVDWGFRLAQLYGQDYRYTTAKGVLSQQLLSSNNTYGYDPVMFYFDIYFPRVAQGMDIRMGRYISLPDIEAQLAPNNYTYSHSLLYTIDPYTQTGIVASVKLSNHWLTQVGFSGGNDVAPWTKDVTPTLTACVSYTWHQGGDMLYPCINSLNQGKYAYNNLQSYYLTWYHKINASWHTDTETWYMYERDVPNIAGNVANPITPETGANGAYCPTSVLRCTAPEFAFVNYLEKEFTKKDYLSIRNEFVNDERGQRTGYVTRYSEHLVSYGHWIGSTILFRPEIRYEHSYNEAAYDLGKKKSQFIVAGDVTYHF